jgi:hypothetical protein
MSQKSKDYGLSTVDLFSGQSLFEVVLALGVMTIVTVGIIILTLHAVRNASFSRDKNLSSKYTLEAIEWLRNQKEQDPPSFFLKDNTSSIYCLDSLSWSNMGACGASETISGGPYTRSLNLSQIGQTMTVTVVVSWIDSKGYHESRSTTDFVDTRQ